MIFQALTAVSVKSEVFWNARPRVVVDSYLRFGGTSFLYLLGNHPSDCTAFRSRRTHPSGHFSPSFRLEFQFTEDWHSVSIRSRVICGNLCLRLLLTANRSE
jgi:hypothetical protein